MKYACIAIFALVASPALAMQDESLQGGGDAPPKQRSHIIESGKEKVIGVGAVANGWTCTPTQPPVAILDEPPARGSVCARHNTVVTSSQVGSTDAKVAESCKTSPKYGVEIIYSPYPGYVGRDKLVYTLEFPLVRQPYEVDIVIAPSMSGNSSVAIAGVGGGDRQKPGLMVECDSPAS